MELEIIISKEELREKLQIVDGHTPTKTELLDLIRPLIKEPKDGRTPSDMDIIRLIKPLLPKDDTIINSVLKKLPKPEKGDKGDTGESIKGDKGDAGSPDSAKDIIEKLKPLPKGERLSYNWLDDLPTIFKDKQPGLAGAGYFRELGDVPSVYKGNAGKLLKVRADENGLDYYSLSESDPIWALDKPNYSTTAQADLLYYPLSTNPAGYLTALTGAWLNATAQTGLTGDKTGTFNLTTTGTLGAGVTTLAGNNANAAFTLLNLNNNATPTTGQVAQTSDLVFNLTQKIGAAVSLHEAARISAYKVSDWFHATTEADTDSGLRFWTTDAGTAAVKWTISNTGSLLSGTDGTSAYAITTAGTGRFLNSYPAYVDGSNYIYATVVGGVSPEIDFYTGGSRAMVFGYDPNVSRGIFYSDASGQGVFFRADGLGLGAIGGDTLASQVLQIPIGNTGVFIDPTFAGTYDGVSALHINGTTKSTTGIFAGSGDIAVDNSGVITGTGILLSDAPIFGTSVIIQSDGWLNNAYFAGSGGGSQFIFGAGSSDPLLSDFTYIIGSRPDTYYGTANAFFIHDDKNALQLFEADTTGVRFPNLGNGTTVTINDIATGSALNVIGLSVFQDATAYTYYAEIGGSAVAGYFEDSSYGNNVYLADGTYAINATGPSLLTGDVWIPYGNNLLVNASSPYNNAFQGLEAYGLSGFWVDGNAGGYRIAYFADPSYSGYFADTNLGTSVTLNDGTYAINAIGNFLLVGNQYIQSDTGILYFGASDDMSVTYDGTDGIINTSLVNASDLTITCGAAKTLVLGTSVYKDINIAGVLLSKPTSSAPGTDTFRSTGGTDTTIETYAFAVDEKVHGGFELQHDYKEGTDLVFHVHWQGIAAPTGTDNVQWRLNYIVARDGVTLAAATVFDSPDTAINTRYRCYRTDFAAITGTNFKIGDQFMFTLTRVASTGDAYAGDALIETAGIHYEIDTLGSRSISIK